MAFQQLSIDWHKHIPPILEDLAAAAIGGAFTIIFRVYRPITRAMRVLWHCLQTLDGRRFILVWNDVDPCYSVKLIEALRPIFRHRRFKALTDIEHVRNYKLTTGFVAAVVIIDADVSKFSVNPKTAKQIDNELVRFLMRGGGIVGTHDVVYSRVRNRKLQAAFGGTITDFCRVPEPVKYERANAAADHILCRGLRDQFELQDGEIIWGRWEGDCTIHFETPESYADPNHRKRALFVSRSYLDGRVVWINSADKKDKLAPSIADLERPFQVMVQNAIQWVCGEDDAAKLRARQIVAHRGLHDDTRRENTCAAFEGAITSGADYAELDVRRSADGVFLVHHDATVCGLTIQTSTWPQLEHAAHIAGYTLNKLDEVLSVCKGRIKLDIELKETGYEAAVLSAITSLIGESEFVITSFSEHTLKHVKDFSPRIRCGLLLGHDKPKDPIRTHWRDIFPMPRVNYSGADFVAPHHRLLKFGLSRRMRSKAIPMWVWTVDEDELIDELLRDASVEAVITDKPELARSRRNNPLSV